MKLIDLKHSRSYYGSMQLGVGIGRYKKHETSVDLVHLFPSFLGPHHLTGRSNLPFCKFATRGDLITLERNRSFGWSWTYKFHWSYVWRKEGICCGCKSILNQKMNEWGGDILPEGVNLNAKSVLIDHLSVKYVLIENVNVKSEHFSWMTSPSSLSSTLTRWVRWGEVVDFNI